MARGDLLLGLDIGTTKVAAVVAERGPEGPVLLGAGRAPSRGLRRGVVIDLDETVAAIEAAVAEASPPEAGRAPGAAYVGITGEHVQCLRSRGAVSINRPERRVVYEDVQRVLRAAAQSVTLPADREIIHCLPHGFTVDGQEGVRNPLGLAGGRLEVATLLVTGQSNLIQNVVRAAERAGLEVEEVVLEPLATADAVLTRAETELGVALLDIGGGTTDYAVLRGGSLVAAGAVPVGGELVTRDLAFGLRTVPEEAEKLKLAAGIARLGRAEADELLEVHSAGGTEARGVPRRRLAEIIEPRMRELLSLSGRALSEAGFRSELSAGVVLTGGGSLLPGTLELAAEVLGCEVRLGRPERVAGIEALAQPDGEAGAAASPTMATAVGLVCYGAQERTAWEGRSPRPGNVARRRLRVSIDRLWHAIRDLFPG